MLKASFGAGDDSHKLYVIKYVPPKYLADIEATKSLYASKIRPAIPGAMRSMSLRSRCR